MSGNPKKEEFQKFYNTHFDKVYRYVFFRVSGNRDLAQDLASEIFMKALEHFASYDESKSKSAWIMTITKNHLANYWRDRKPSEELPDDNIQSDDVAWLSLASKSLKKEEIKLEVARLLEKLDSHTGDIVTFHYLFGYSYAEIAEMKNMTETAVKVAAHRAIKKLSAHI
ncbi:MAG: RNA polymerase sigma factor [Patescibacteria group bacterium]